MVLDFNVNEITKKKCQMFYDLEKMLSAGLIGVDTIKVICFPIIVVIPVKRKQ